MIQSISHSAFRVWAGIKCASLCGFLRLGVSSTALIASLGSEAFALNECGAMGAPPSTLSCNNPIYGSGIEYTNADGLTLDFTDPRTVVAGGVSVLGAANGPGDIVVNAISFDRITAQRGIAVSKYGAQGDARIVLDEGVIDGGIAANGSFGALLFMSTTTEGNGSFIMDGGSVVSRGNDGAGLFVNQQGAGDASIVINDGSIETQGMSNTGAISMVRRSQSIGDASIVMNGGSIVTAQGVQGLSSGGIAAINQGQGAIPGNPSSLGGDAYAEFNGGTITLRGSGATTVTPNANTASSSGVLASIGANGGTAVINPASTGMATARMTDGIISVGNFIFGSGVVAVNWASGGAMSEVTGGEITVNGTSASAVSASIQGNTSSTDNAIVLVSNLTATSNGSNSVGVVAFNAGSGEARIEVSGGSTITSNGTTRASGITARSQGATIARVTGTGTTVTASGQDSSGIWLRQASATSTFEAFVGDGSSVVGGAGLGSAGILVNSLTGNTGSIQVASGGLVDGSNGYAGIREFQGDAIVTVEGEVRNGIDLGGGEDTVNLLLGSLTSGGVDTGADDDMVNIGGISTGGIATLTGGIETAEGVDHVTLAGGSVVSGGLDTGDGNDVFRVGSSTATVASLSGGINAGLGDDTGALLTGSVMVGDILMSRGSDNLTIEGGADITGATMIDGGDDFSISDGEIDVLELNGGNRYFSGGDLTNWETINLTGSADITFAGRDLETGSAQGTGPHGLPNGLVVQSGATARFDGNFTVDGNLTNRGTVDLRPDAALGTTLNVTGDYTGDVGSTLLMDVFLQDGLTDNNLSTDIGISDHLIVAGNGSGSTVVDFNNIGGPGALTDLNSNGVVDNNEGILFAQVQGTSTANLFTLGTLSGTTIGAFTYDLVYFDDQNSASGEHDYVLANRFSNVSEPYEVYPRAVMFTMPTLHQRVGNRHWDGQQPELPPEIFCKDPDQNYRCTITEEQASYYGEEKLIEENSAWVRIVGSHARIAPTVSTTGLVNYNIETVEIQAGIDRLLRESDEGNKWIGGLNAQISTAGVTGNDPNGDASMKATGLGIGGTLTYYKPNGFYTDIQARLMAVSTDFASTSGSYDNARSVVASASVEVGRKYEFGDGWRVVPQAQLTYTQARFRSFVDTVGTVVEPDDAESLKLRVGVNVGRERNWVADDGTARRLEVEAGLNLHKELSGRTRVNVSGTPLYNEEESATVEVTLGATYNWNDDRNSVYGEVGMSTGLRNLGRSRRISGTVGFRRRWN